MPEQRREHVRLLGNVKSITVASGNSATVTNDVDTSSNTGSNGASGSGSSGEGGHHDSSATGGVVLTGNAISKSGVVTIGNVNITQVN